ncbi:hypothetical protein Patl1_16071 [Pistacia atlantica]|uniref:Uncharacterized protein n=1 Tax=Pistacia atlantica TaxID=434234 RepID=A0ACC1B961_9ROSI|nr:hypothetical protein Patl1_16071 [Pistacia atlantica]
MGGGWCVHCHRRHFFRCCKTSSLSWKLSQKKTPETSL